mgnify:CR=1 FL=1
MHAQYFFRKQWLLTLFCLLISFSSWAATNPLILVVGDSLSAEYGLARGTGWVGYLESKLKSDGSPWYAFNASISGETTSGGLARLPRLLEQKNPGMVMIELGANDALRGLPIADTERNLRQMIQMSKKIGAKVVLFGMQIPPNYGQTYTTNFKTMYVSLAKEENIPLLPFFLEGIATKPEFFQADRIHPNEAAQKKLFENVWGTLAPYRDYLKSAPRQ